MPFLSAIQLKPAQAGEGAEKGPRRIQEMVLPAVLFLLFFIYFLTPIRDVDAPWHMKTGQYIVENREIPVKDPFLHSTEKFESPREKRVLSQYWLSQVSYWMLYRIAGFPGLAVMNSLLFTFMCLFIWAAFRKKGPFVSSTMALLAAPILKEYTGFRPQVFTFFFTVLVVVILDGYIEDARKRRTIFLLPLIMLVWSNLHGGFLFGDLILVMFAGPELVKALKKDTDPVQKKRSLQFCGISLAAVAASFANPNGLKALPTALNPDSIVYVSGRKVMDYFSLMEQFYRNPNIKQELYIFWIFLAYILIVVALSLTRRTFRVRDLLLVPCTLYMTVKATRYMPLFLLTTLPLAARHEFHMTIPPRVIRAARVAIVAIAVFSFSYITYGAAVKGVPEDFSFDHVWFAPSGAVQFIQENGISGNILNNQYHGGYLIYRLYPQKIFSDTRSLYTQIREDGYAIEDSRRTPEDRQGPFYAILGSILYKYPELKVEIGEQTLNRESEGGKPAYWKELLDRYGIDIIVYKACDPFTGNAYALPLSLYRDDQWELVYNDGDVMIFLRNTEKFGDLIRKHRKDKINIFEEIMMESVVGGNASLSSMALGLMMTGRLQGGLEIAQKAAEINQQDMLARLIAAFCRTLLKLDQQKQGS